MSNPVVMTMVCLYTRGAYGGSYETTNDRSIGRSAAVVPAPLKVCLASLCIVVEVWDVVAATAEGRSSSRRTSGGHSFSGVRDLRVGHADDVY